MKVSYKNSLQDIIDLNIYYAENSSVNKKRLIIFQKIIPILIALYIISLYINHYKVSPILIVIAIIISILWIMFYPKIYRERLVRIVTKQVYEIHGKNAFDDVTLTLDDEGITKESKFINSKVAWVCIEKVLVTEKHIFIIVNNASAFVIPLNVFSSISEKDTFLSFIHMKTNK